MDPSTMISPSIALTRSYALWTAKWLIALNLPGFALLRTTGVKVVEDLFGPGKNRSHKERRRQRVTPDLLPGLVYPANTHSRRFIQTKRGTEIHVQSRIPTDIKPKDIRAVICLCRKFKI
jgi:hypothetical protein